MDLFNKMLLFGDDKVKLCDPYNSDEYSLGMNNAKLWNVVTTYYIFASLWNKIHNKA